MKNIHNDFLLYQRGIIISSPTPIRMVLGEDKKPTWAEKRKNELVYQLKRKQVRANNWKLFTIKAIISFVILIGVLILAGMTCVFLNASSLLMFLISINGVLLILLLLIISNDLINDTWKITHAKHKNKTYYIWQ